MNKEEIFCQNCEAEFYVESEYDIIYCIQCGEEIGYDDEETEEDYDENWEE
jgi:predicted RNA-binding Zn-ribbon protein involved in translation (DUF1610 family)